MSGIRFTIRTPVADIGDTFNRANGALSGATPVGSRAWQISGAGSTVPGIESNTLKATSGTGNKMAVVTVGRRNYDVQYRLAAADSSSVVPWIVLQGTDAANHIMVLHRLNAGSPQYVIGRRRTDSVFDVLQTGVVPRAGDFVRIRVRNGNTFTLIVNGVNLGTAVVAEWEDKPLVGFNLNGADTVSAFDDFEIFLR